MLINCIAVQGLPPMSILMPMALALLEALLLALLGLSSNHVIPLETIEQQAEINIRSALNLLCPLM